MSFAPNTSSFLLTSPDLANLPNSRTLEGASGISLSDTGAAGTLTIKPVGNLLSLYNYDTSGYLTYNSVSNTFAGRTLQGSASISITNSNGVSGNSVFSVNPSTTIQQINVALNGNVDSTQSTINLIQGNGISITVNDNNLNSRADITIASNAASSSATYITQTPSDFLPNEQALSLLSTGILKSTTTTGVLSIAIPNTDYQSANSNLTAISDLSPVSGNLIIGNGATFVSLSPGPFGSVLRSSGSGVGWSTLPGTGTVTSVQITSTGGTITVGGAGPNPITTSGVIDVSLPNTGVTAGTFTYPTVTVTGQGVLTSIESGLTPAFNATYILQTPYGDLPSAQSLSLLSTGILKSTTNTGVLSIDSITTSISNTTPGLGTILYGTGTGYTVLEAPTNEDFVLKSQSSGGGFIPYWANPDSGGTVTSVQITSTGGTITVGGAGPNPITTSGVIDISLPNTGVTAGTFTYPTVTVTGQGVLTSIESGLTPAFNATYILQTPYGDLPSAQSLSLLSTGILKSTTNTGVLSIDSITTSISNTTPGLGTILYGTGTGYTVLEAPTNEDFVLKSQSSGGGFIPYWANPDSGGTVTSVQITSTGGTITVGGAGPNPITTSGVIDISLPNTGVTAGTFTYPTVTVTEQGVLTSIASGLTPRFNATYILQTPDGNLPSAQSLSLLSTGILKSTTTTGVLSIDSITTSISNTTPGLGTILYGTGTGYTVLEAPTNEDFVLKSQSSGGGFIPYWANPDSGGTVTSVQITSTGGTITVGGAGPNPITTSGVIDISLPNTGVTAGTFTYPTVTVTEQGVLTSIESGLTPRFDATYILQTPDGNLPSAQSLSLLSTGILKSTTTTGVLSIDSITTSISNTTPGLGTILYGTGTGYTVLEAPTNEDFVLKSQSSGGGFIPYWANPDSGGTVTSVQITSTGGTITVGGAGPNPITTSGVIDISLPNTGVTAGTFTNPTVIVTEQGVLTSIANGAPSGDTVYTVLAESVIAQNIELQHAYAGTSTDDRVIFTLPNGDLSGLEGQTFKIAGIYAGGWRIAQNANQIISYLSTATTVGVTGYVDSNSNNEAIEVLYVGINGSNQQFNVVNSTGNPLFY